MKLGRRSFLKGLAAAPVAAPAVAAELGSASALQAGVSAFGSFSPSSGNRPLGRQTSVNSIADYEAARANTTRWLLANGVPQWMRDNIRREIGPPTRLDPDLAAARSFSLSAKMRMQHERDVERRCRFVLDYRLGQSAAETWRKATGLDLW